ncbi:hypothetical protein BDP55DRAFT_720369 [Colletotrichum godetiae]|uniref:Uncharacterized protein n=1 Tax=Colletotrichum godetiae TaxID=1209918 RepID=A0AAJ0AAC5_9PEZI|nr:uncharacterized protein BDP55DRAFT_720369 [Colletotrichum godetiae]KAK1658859.1 hypothetical protein BDP55DRAFT_720369 [Colletotrichum godetiae]
MDFTVQLVIKQQQKCHQRITMVSFWSNCVATMAEDTAEGLAEHTGDFSTTSDDNEPLECRTAYRRFGANVDRRRGPQSSKPRQRPSERLERYLCVVHAAGIAVTISRLAGDFAMHSYIVKEACSELRLEIPDFCSASAESSANGAASRTDPRFCPCNLVYSCMVDVLKFRFPSGDAVTVNSRIERV